MLKLPPVEEVPGLNDFPVFYWNHAGLQMNRVTHSLGGPQTGPTMSSRALGLLQLAMHDAYFGAQRQGDANSPQAPYLHESEFDGLPNIGTYDLDHFNQALTGAAISVLDNLYAQPGGVSISATNTLTSTLSQLIADFQPYIETLSPAYQFGTAVAWKILDKLAIKAGQPGADAGRYEPRQGRFYFRDEPVNPVKRAFIDPNDPSRGTKTVRNYHGPFYGSTAPEFAVSDPDGHQLAPWPAADYDAALREVVQLGGAGGLPKTDRKPDQTVAGFFWAYDGANLIGTPPRLYNQIVRQIAWDNRKPAVDDLIQTNEFVRLLALVNTAMADAGKFAWKEKYRYELWRPLSGVREHDKGDDPDTIPPGHEHLANDADPFWLALGAPETNTHKIPFKPPFPAYPSGHATFGAAAFQMTRLFYKQRDKLGFADDAIDPIDFSFVSEELNGVSRDLHDSYDANLPIEEQPGVIRTRIRRRFPSLWHAIFENAFSRIYLGVHWRFDAADAADMLDSPVTYKSPDKISYSHVWTGPRNPGDPLPIGGVPLGLGIANDIFANGMRAKTATTTETSSAPVTEPRSKISNTNIR